MRFLLVAHYFAPHLGGLEEVVRRQALSLVERGHDVVVVTSLPESGVPLEEEIDGYRVIRLPSINATETKLAIPYPLVYRGWGKLRALVRGAGVVHLHDVFYPIDHLAWLACRLESRRYFVTQHVAKVPHPKAVVMGVQEAVYRGNGYRILQGAQRVVCYNPIVEAFLVESAGVRPSRVVRTVNGVDVELFTPRSDVERKQLRERHGLDPEATLVLFVGRLVPKKGFDIVAAATDPSYQILIVGGGDAAVNAPPEEGLRWWGAAPAAVVRELCQAADLFCFPAEGEMLTLVMQEAMACGLPIVAYDDPGYAATDLDRELIRWVDRDVQSVRSSLIELAADADQRKLMSQYSRSLAVGRFDWGANYANEYAIYAELLGSPRSSR